MLNEGVVLSLGALFLILLSGDSDANTVGEVADTLRPDELVELGIDTHIRGTHHLGDPLADSLHGLGGFFLELSAVGQLVHVDGRVDGCLGEAASLLLLDHYH